MTLISRALLLCAPLVLFAIAGALYSPETPESEDTDIALGSLPELPDWTTDGLPDFSNYQDTIEKKAAFFSFLYPRIELANNRILLEREYLQSLSGKDELADDELEWLERQADRLRVEAKNGSPKQFEQLTEKLDVIPPSLIMAQAANESAWGTSRFATEGNNLFGQWCFTQGCGLVPMSRVDGASHEVAKFESPYQSVRSYIQNLNRHPTYQPLRDIRLQDRQAEKPLSGWHLAEGLLGYSERGEDYIKEIRSMIRYNNLEFYDREFRKLLGDRTLDTFEQLASADADTTLLPGAEGSLASPFDG